MSLLSHWSLREWSPASRAAATAARRAKHFQGSGLRHNGEPYGVAVLPTRKTINPIKDEGEYAEPGMHHIIVNNDDGKPRSITGGFGEDVMPGDTIHLVHDQTGKALGYRHAKIVGVKTQDGTIHGHVPDAKIPHYVLK